MAGCIPCFVIPLLLFIFHRYIQPLLLKFWNPWAPKALEVKLDEGDKKNCEFSCECSWSKKKSVEGEPAESSAEAINESKEKVA